MNAADLPSISRLRLHALARAGIWTAILLPPFFLLLAVQYSAITFPYWDHCELVKFFAKYYDGNLSLHDLWAPHNHTRPLTYRVVMLLNGVLTRWDIRSEYIYLLASLYGAFAVLAGRFRKTFESKPAVVPLMFLAAVSVFHFSPAGHNNHWWSMMCQLTFTHFFIVAALVWLAAAPLCWKNNAGAAVACWLASYTLTNGIFAFVSALAMVQFAHEEPWRPNRFTWFWVANLVVLQLLYWPGLPETPGNLPVAGPVTLLYFCLVYIGSPVWGILNYSFTNQGGSPRPEWPAVCGFLQLVATIWLAVGYRAWLRRRSPEALLFLGFTLFTWISAAGTGRARAAFDHRGAGVGADSRYTIFGAYAVYGLLFFLAGLIRDGEWKPLLTGRLRGWGRASVALGFGLFLLLGLRSYATSARVYRHIHDLNERLGAAFLSPTPRPDLEKSIYPSPEGVTQMKAELRRLGIGPYRAWNP